MKYFLEHNCFSYEECWASYQSWRAHIIPGNNNSVVQKMDKFFDETYTKFNKQKGNYHNMYTNYICYNDFKGTDINQNPIFLPKGWRCVCYQNYLVTWTGPNKKEQKIICHNDSDIAYNYFCQDDDDKGVIRGELLNYIQNSLKIEKNNYQD